MPCPILSLHGSRLSGNPLHSLIVVAWLISECVESIPVSSIATLTARWLSFLFSSTIRCTVSSCVNHSFAQVTLLRYNGRQGMYLSSPRVCNTESEIQTGGSIVGAQFDFDSCCSISIVEAVPPVGMSFPAAFTVSFRTSGPPQHRPEHVVSTRQSNGRRLCGPRHPII